MDNIRSLFSNTYHEIDNRIDRMLKVNQLWFSVLTEKEIDAIKHYSGNGYSKINRFLRGIDKAICEADIKRIRLIDNALRKNIFNESIIVHRGINKKTIEALVYKDADLIGKCFNERGYSSTSILDQNHFTYDNEYVLEIYLPKGSHGGYLDYELNCSNNFVIQEREVLLPRNGLYKIDNIKYKGSKTILGVIKLV